MKIFSLLPFIIVPIFFNHSIELNNGLTFATLQSSISAPADLVLSCEIEIDTLQLKSTDQDYLGTISREKDKKLIVQSRVCKPFCDSDPIINYPGNQSAVGQIACTLFNQLFDSNDPSKKYNLEFGDQGYYEGFDTFKIKLIDKRKCGLGLIQRQFIGINNNVEISSDIQDIWVIPCTRLFIDEQNLCNPDDDLIWQEPYCDPNYILKINGCGISFDSNTSPRLRNIECSLLTIEHRDEIFTSTNLACFLIHRTISVIDWCIYDPFIDPKKGRYSFLQKIEITDKNKPIVSCDVGPCEPIVLINSQCHAPIKLTAEATDNCSPNDWLLWEYRIDLFNDGVGKYNGYDLQVGKLSKKAKQSGDTLEIADNPYAKNPKDPFEATGTYPLGVHKICWFVEDGCGNVGTCCTLFEVKDCVAPVIEAKDKFITQLLKVCVDIFPQDLILKASDQCTKKENLKFYFDGDPNKTSIRICCDDFVASQAANCGELHMKSELWCEDEAENKSFVSASIIILDTISICPNSDMNQKIIKVQNHESNKLSQAYITQFVTVEHRRAYIFCQDAIIRDYCNNSPFKISKNSYYGTDVLDLILLNEHILGKATFKYFEFFAGDLNHSKGITSSDKSLLTNLILERQMKDWIFFQKEDSTPLKDFNTFNCPDSCNIIGVMNGDVSLNALTGCNDSLFIPSDCIEFRINNHEVLTTLSTYPIYCNSNKKIKGFQIDLNANLKNIDILNIDAEQGFEIKHSNINPGDSIIRIICISESEESILPDPIKPIINFTLQSNTIGRVSDFIKLDNTLKENSAYDSTYSKYGICLNYSTNTKNKTSNDNFKIYPNPSNGQFIITGDDLNSISNIDIISNDGRIIQSYKNIIITSDKYEIKTNLVPGLYYCKINKTIMKKLIVIK